MPKISCGGVYSVVPKGWGEAPHPMGMFLTPSLTRPLHTVPTVESLHISLEKETTENLACEDLSVLIKKWGLQLLA